MLDTVAKECPAADGVPNPLPKPARVPGETPRPGTREPSPVTGPAAELDRHDWCSGVRHEQRVIEALQKVEEPTPAKVRKTLNSLGYIDERIHDLKQAGKTTRFYLDLREKGGQLCEAGVASGATSDMNPCVAQAGGPFTVKTEAQP